MAFSCSWNHIVMFGGLEKQGVMPRSCKRFFVKCSLDGNGPATPGRIIKLKDSISMAADGKTFLLFNRRMDGSTNDGLTMEHASSVVNRPTASVHRYTLQCIENAKSKPVDSENIHEIFHSDDVQQELNEYAAEGRYFIRLYLGNKLEQLLTEVNDLPYNYSTHMLDIHKKELDADDIAYLSNIQNPKCMEIKKGTDIDLLVEKCKLINPNNTKGSVVVTVQPYLEMPLYTYVEKFIAAAVEATWVINPIMFSPSDRPGRFIMHTPEECQSFIHAWHAQLHLAGAHFGGLFLEDIQQLEWGEEDPVLPEVFLQECGHSLRVLEELEEPLPEEQDLVTSDLQEYSQSFGILEDPEEEHSPEQPGDTALDSQEPGQPLRILEEENLPEPDVFTSDLQESGQSLRILEEENSLEQPGIVHSDLQERPRSFQELEEEDSAEPPELVA